MLATAYSALVGWLYQDAGDLKRSMHWHDVMLELAHRSGDVQHIGFALANKAMLRVDMGDGRGAVDLASAALAGQGRLCPKVRVLALQQAAHGLSLMGDRDGCDRLIDQAQLFLAKVDDAYPWGNACRALGYLDVQRATCHGRLGDPQSALEIWVEVLRDAGASSRRDLGVFRARQATALARSGESEEAVKIAAEVVPLVAETGSARMLRELINLRNVMIAERHELAGRNLEEMLSGAGLDSRRQWR